MASGDAGAGGLVPPSGDAGGGGTVLPSGAPASTQAWSALHVYPAAQSAACVHERALDASPMHGYPPHPAIEPVTGFTLQPSEPHVTPWGLHVPGPRTS